jgi:hypothetical protein
MSEMREFLNHPLTAMEFEEIFETGRRMEMRILHPFWDSDLVELLCRTPPALLNLDGRSKGLVRGMLARKFPQLGFERQKKVISLDFFQSTMIREGADAWQTMGGTRALAELGVVNAKSLGSTLEAILAASQKRQAYRFWDVLTVEAWLRPRL